MFPSSLKSVMAAGILAACLSGRIRADQSVGAPLPAAAGAAVPAAQGPLTSEQLSRILEGLGYEVRTADLADGTPFHQVAIERGGWVYYLNFSFSTDGTILWLDMALTGQVAAGEIPRAQLVKLLDKNAAIGPAHFVYSESSGQISLYLPIDNRGITPAVLRRAIDRFLSVVLDTQEDWDPQRWSASPELPPIDAVTEPTAERDAAPADTAVPDGLVGLDGGLAAAMPGEVARDVRPFGDGSEGELVVHWSRDERGVTYFVAYCDHVAADVEEVSVEERFAADEQALLQGIGGTIVAEKPVSMAGHDATEYLIAKEDGTVIVARTFILGARFLAVAVGPLKTITDAEQQFLDSFRVL